MNASCANKKGSFHCIYNAGWEGTGDVCTDVNKCAAKTYPCDPQGACTNIDGSFEGACEAGYAGDGFTFSDINKCPEAACDVNAAFDTIAEFHVYTCNTGYSGDGQTCTDDDEYVSGDICHVTLASCTNTDGSYQCAGNEG